MNPVVSLKYTISTVIFSLISVWLCFYPLIYPSWFSQRYIDKDQNIDVAQGFGLWAFRSTNELHSDPFYSSKTFYLYSTLCHLERNMNSNFPNWMLGAGMQYQQALCVSQITIIQGLMVAGAVLALLTLLAAIYALYASSITKAESIISYFTLLSSLFIAVAMLLWGWSIQQDLYRVDPLNSQYTTCKSMNSPNKSWNCWFYGKSFWIALCSVISTSVVGYVGSLSKSEKLKLHRKTYERDLQLALQASTRNLDNTNRNVTGLNSARSPAPPRSTPGTNVRTPIATNYHGYAGNGRNDNNGNAAHGTTGNARPQEETNTPEWNKQNTATDNYPRTGSQNTITTSPASAPRSLPWQQPTAPPAPSANPYQQRTININDRNFIQNQRRDRDHAMNPALRHQTSSTEYAL